MPLPRVFLLPALRWAFGIATVAASWGQTNPLPNNQAVGQDPALVDRVQSRVANTVDGAARWVDSFFGDNRYDPDQKGAFGRLYVLPYWYEYNGLEAESRFAAYLPLENVSHRVHAIIGRGDEDELITNDYGFEDLLPRDNGEDSWLMGLGYKPPWSHSGRVSLGAGVKIDWPLDPYVRISYRATHDFSEQSLVRFRTSLFWQNSEDIGSTTVVDLERRVTKDNLLRWSNWGKVSGRTEGLRYDSRVALFRNLHEDRGVVFAVGLRGDTGEPVPVRDYGFYGVYRQKVWRDWFYAQVLAGFAFYRENDWADRELALLGGIGFEMFFSANNFEEESLLDLRDLSSRYR